MAAVVDKDVRDAATASAEEDLAERLDALEARVVENAVSIGRLEEANERLTSENALLRRGFDVFRAAGNIMGMADLLFMPEMPATPHPET